MKFERCIDVGTHQGLLAASGRPAACGTAGALHDQCIARHMRLAPERLDNSAAQNAESSKREYGCNAGRGNAMGSSLRRCHLRQRSPPKTAFPNFDDLITASWNVVSVYANIGSDFEVTGNG
jgi:hypothetical protein